MNELEAKQKRIWQYVAGNWRDDAREVEIWFEPITNAIVAALGDECGLLADLGCGAGSIRYPRSWKVVGLDIAEDMVKAHGCAAIGSFNPLPFKSESFDAIVSRFGFIFAADVMSALREARRALKPGGKIVFSVWGPPEQNPALSIPTRIGIEMLGLDKPKPTDPGAFRLADTHEVRSLLLRSQFAAPNLETVVVPHHQSIGRSEAWSQVLAFAGPVSTLYARMNPAQCQEFEARVMDAWSQSDLTGVAHVWSARRGP